MNKVINDLYVQSLELNEQSDDRITVDPVKFAQLVVEECIKDLFTDECLCNHSAYKQYSARVKLVRDRFGIVNDTVMQSHSE